LAVVATVASYGSRRNAVSGLSFWLTSQSSGLEGQMVAIDESTAVGVSFSLAEEQKQLRRLARTFAEREIRPNEAEHDAAMRHPAEVIAQAHGLGLMNLHVPAEYGGPGLSAFDGMLVGEEINWGCTGIGTSILANGLGSA